VSAAWKSGSVVVALVCALLALSGSAFADASNPATTTTLTLNPSVVAAGSPVTMTATVTGVGGNPTGRVTFANGGTPIGTAPLSPVAGSTTKSQAVLVASLPAGTYSVTATYRSDNLGSFFNSTSSTVKLTVSTYPIIYDTQTTLNGVPPQVMTGESETLTVQVARVGDSGIPTGIVTFYDTGVNIGQATLDASGTATLTRSDFLAGSHSFVASYEGDAVDHASSSAAVNVQVNAPPQAVQTMITVHATPNPIIAGEEMTISAHVVQAGTQTPPPAAALVTFRTIGPTGAFLGQTTLDANGDASITVGGWIPGAYTIEADYVGDVNDLGSSGSLPVTVAPPGADLSLSASGPATTHTGDHVTDSFVVTNNGLESAQNVRVTATLPAGTSFVSGTPACAVAGEVVTCALGTMASGTQQTVTLVLAVGNGLAGTSITSKAQVRADTADPDSTDNAASATTQVRALAGLSVTSTGTAAAFGGDALAYTVVVRNAGPDAADAVVLADTLPGDLTAATFTTSAGTCSLASGTLTCQLGTLAAGGSATVNIAGTLSATTAATSASNTASVTSSTDDSTTADNSATTTTAVTPLADLTVSTLTGPATAFPGTTLTYTITVSNLGPGPGHALLADPLPADTTLVGVTTTAGSCTGGVVVSCDLGTLASGGSATVTVTVLLSASSNATSLTNTATVSAAGGNDRTPADDSASATTTVLQVGCPSVGSVHGNEDFRQVIGGTTRIVHVQVEGDCDRDKRSGKVFLHHGHVRVQIDGQKPLIDVRQEDDANDRGLPVMRVAITGPDDAVISGTYAGLAFTVTLHDGGSPNKDDTVRVQYGSFDTATLATKHANVNVENH
jgi:uncharacterized repeat protein (TIGR01451 family)